MKLPEAFTNDSDLGMCYEKKVIMSIDVFMEGNITDQVFLIERLLQCMKETNILNNHNFPFYQLRIRPTNLYDNITDPAGICFELRWGNREMLHHPVSPDKPI